MSQPEAEWYYAQSGQQMGPVTLAALREAIAGGAVSMGDLVWTQGMAQWAAASTVPELATPVNPPGYAQPQSYAQPQPYAPSQSPAAQPLPQQQGLPPMQWQEVAPLGYYQPAAVASYAGFWLRFVALIIDWVVTFVLGAIVGGCAGGVIGFSLGAGNASQQQIQASVTPVAQVLGIVIGWLYYALMESSSKQATLGKMALGLRVTDLAGGRIGFGRATGRHFGKILSWLTLAIGFFMAGFTERKQALHDMLAGTLVVRGPASPAYAAPYPAYAQPGYPYPQQPAGQATSPYQRTL